MWMRYAGVGSAMKRLSTVSCTPVVEINVFRWCVRELCSSSSVRREGSVSSEGHSYPLNSARLMITEISATGKAIPRIVKKSDVLTNYQIQARDLRFSTASSLFVRADNIIFRLENLKAIIRHDRVLLLESDNEYVQTFIPELQRVIRRDHDLPFEFVAMETMLMKKLSGLDEELVALESALKHSLDHLLNPQFISMDKGELHMFLLLQQSSRLSEFHSLVKDIEVTLTEVLDAEDDMADMYLTHYVSTSEDRTTEDIEDICNLLEAYACQVENMLSKIQTLRELIDSSESITLINLDINRNVMLRLSLQLEMGMFSAAIAGLIGMAFGMNLESSLEESRHVFWLVTGAMLIICGLLWRTLLKFLGKCFTRGVAGLGMFKL